MQTFNDTGLTHAVVMYIYSRYYPNKTYIVFPNGNFNFKQKWSVSVLLKDLPEIRAAPRFNWYGRNLDMVLLVSPSAEDAIPLLKKEGSRILWHGHKHARYGRDRCIRKIKDDSPANTIHDLYCVWKWWKIFDALAAGLPAAIFWRKLLQKK